MHKEVLEAIDSIDATLFIGDSFLDDDNREMLRQKLKRWEKQCKVFDELSECLKNCEDEEQD